MKVVQINGGVFGSTGKIMFGISNLAEKNNIETKCFSPVTSTNHNRETNFPYEKCGTYRGRQISVFIDRITGYNGCSAVITTKKLLKKITSFNPDVIHLHNLHNSYINLPMLFNYIKKHNIHTVWTLHDCWAFTGQCPYFTMVKCDKWKTGCHHCPQYRQYPQSYVDRTKTMWRLKKKWFTGVQNMVIVTPSQWLANLVKESFLKDYSVKVIRNGIDLDVFKPTANSFRQAYGLQNKKIILSVAFGWGERKGYGDCLKLAGILDDDYHMVLVGVSKEQISALPKNVLGIERTNSQKELVEIYSASDVFINTTYEDNYPTVNLEARACGLPIITYKTGGSPESAGTDAVSVETGDILSLKEAVETTIEARKQQKVKNEDISSDAKFKEYIELYRSANAGGGGYTLRKKYDCIGKCILLGVAFGWGKRKGLDVFVELAKRLDERYQIVLVGTDDEVDKQLPSSIISIHRTQNQQELAELYSMADFFVNPTREETLGMVNLEALACGTPVITFNTGGSPECIDENCGIVVECDDIDALETVIVNSNLTNLYLNDEHIERVLSFDEDECSLKYLKLYNENA